MVAGRLAWPWRGRAAAKAGPSSRGSKMATEGAVLASGGAWILDAVAWLATVGAELAELASGGVWLAVGVGVGRRGWHG